MNLQKLLSSFLALSLFFTHQILPLQRILSKNRSKVTELAGNQIPIYTIPKRSITGAEITAGIITWKAIKTGAAVATVAYCAWQAGQQKKSLSELTNQIDTAHATNSVIQSQPATSLPRTTTQPPAPPLLANPKKLSYPIVQGQRAHSNPSQADIIMKPADKFAPPQMPPSLKEILKTGKNFFWNASPINDHAIEFTPIELSPDLRKILESNAQAHIQARQGNYLKAALASLHSLTESPDRIRLRNYASNLSLEDFAYLLGIKIGQQAQELHRALQIEAVKKAWETQSGLDQHFLYQLVFHPEEFPHNQAGIDALAQLAYKTNRWVFSKKITNITTDSEALSLFGKFCSRGKMLEITERQIKVNAAAAAQSQANSASAAQQIEVANIIQEAPLQQSYVYPHVQAFSDALQKAVGDVISPASLALTSIEVSRRGAALSSKEFAEELGEELAKNAMTKLAAQGIVAGTSTALVKIGAPVVAKTVLAKLGLTGIVIAIPAWVAPVAAGIGAALVARTIIDSCVTSSALNRHHARNTARIAAEKAAKEAAARGFYNNLFVKGFDTVSRNKLATIACISAAFGTYTATKTFVVPLYRGGSGIPQNIPNQNNNHIPENNNQDPEEDPKDIDAAKLAATIAAAEAVMEEGEEAGLVCFKSAEDFARHFIKHGNEFIQNLRQETYSLKEYLYDANFTLRNGKFLPERNAYMKFISDLRDIARGEIKYVPKAAYCGLDRITGKITTFNVRSLSDISRIAPSGGIEIQQFIDKFGKGH